MNIILLQYFSNNYLGGNFHGEYPAKALDYLTIATHELGSISEVFELINKVNYKSIRSIINQ
jgi:histidine ammonia-lyase